MDNNSKKVTTDNTTTSNDESSSSTVKINGNTKVRSCEGIIKNFLTTEKQHVLSTYRRFFPVASGSAYKFGLHGQLIIVMGNECNGTGGILVRGKGSHRSCSFCTGLNNSKIYQTIGNRVNKIVEAELILKRREIDPMDVKKLQNIYRNGISDKYFTAEGALVAKVSVDISLLTRLTDVYVKTYPLSHKIYLFQSCKDKVDYYTHIQKLLKKDHNNTVKAMDGNGILNSDKFLRDFVGMYLNKKSGLQESLMLCLMRAFISKANGAKRKKFEPKARNFMMALAATNKQACELLSANLNLATPRTIERWGAQGRGKAVILNEEADVRTLLVTRIEMIRAGLGEDKRVAFSAGGDATKLVKGFGYLHQADLIVGGAYPHHAIDVSGLSKHERQQRLKSLINLEGDVKYATEVNMYVASFQQTPSGMTPSLVIAALPQTTNHSNDWGMKILKAW